MPIVGRPDGSGYVYVSNTPSTLTWTTPTALDAFTYTTIGGNTMPTQAQLDVAQRNLDNARTELTRQFFNIRLACLQRPQMWTPNEAVTTAKNVMKRNMEFGNHGTSRDHIHWRGADSLVAYQNLMTRRRYMYELGQSISQVISNQDDEELVRILNDNDSIRDRNISNWVEMLNDGDRFNGPEYDYCSDCNYIEASDDGSWIYDGDRWVCSDCREENYRWSDYRDCVVHIDDYEDEEEEEEEYEERSIGGYHSSRRKLGFIPTTFSERKTKIFMGLELEMEVVDADRYDKADLLMEEIGMYKDPNGHMFNYCFLEDDGSINHGFEMVTGYTGLDVHAKQLEFFKRPWANVKSHDTKTCGLHVHICKKGMTMFHAAKLILFMHDSRNQRLFRAIARRDANRYSQVKNKTADYSWLKHARARGSMQSLNDDRYEAVNFQPEKTIEFRLFKGTLRYETIMACLEFTYATWFFTRDTGQQDLTADQFLKYISLPEHRKDTVNLRSFLRSKGFSLDKSAVVKRNPRVEQDEPQQLAEV